MDSRLRGNDGYGLRGNAVPGSHSRLGGNNGKNAVDVIPAKAGIHGCSDQCFSQTRQPNTDAARAGVFEKGPAAHAAGPPNHRHRPAPRYAAMNSFHFRTMYRFSSITEFQHSTAPIRSWNEPPSRTAPADSIFWPNGLMMSPCAGFPSNQ